MALKVSVIITCFNQAQFLEPALQSVSNQTYNNWECIIIDDGSSDNTKIVAEKWCELDKRFQYFYKENGGLSSARNFGLSKANGAFVQFLDADDLLKPEKFEIQIADLQNCDISISDYFSFVESDINKEAPHRYLSPFLSEEQFKKEIILDWEYRKSIPCHAILFKKEFIDETNLTFDESLPNHEDWVFWTKLFYYSKCIKNNQNVLAFYRIHGTSMSVDFKAMKRGFLKAALVLNAFFKLENNKELEEVTKIKYNEIRNKGSVSILKKIKNKLAYIYH